MNKLKKIDEIRNKLKSQKISIGSWMQIDDENVAEIIGDANYDWVAVDLEHGLFDYSNLPNIFRALEIGNTLPIARVSSSDYRDIKLPLEAGAAGIIIPMIENLSQVQLALKNICWPPRGIRGVGFSRSNLYGKYLKEYTELAQKPLVIIQIENQNAVNNLEEILSFSKIDAVLIGPYDLSASVGKLGDFQNIKYKNSYDKIIRLCKNFKVPYGIHIVEPNIELLNSAIKSGQQFLPYSIDSVFMNNSFNNPLKKK